MIQPFDRDKYDRRFKDVFAPAIAAVALEPYRVDNDPSVEIPIESIENGIRSATICFAEITENNPNVWFELGFALAIGKPVVMACAEDRQGNYPFDVRHRTVLRYSTGSTSDFEDLKQRLTERLQALQRSAATVEAVMSTPAVAPVEGLTAHEVAVLATIAGELDKPTGVVAPAHLKTLIQRAGFTSIAATLAIKLLSDKGLIAYHLYQEYDGHEWFGYRIEEPGWQWLAANQQQLVLRQNAARESTALDEEIPF